MNRFFVVALMATCFAANAALETIPLTTNESGRVGWEIGLARSNINAMVELIPELDSKVDSASNTMAAAIALKQDTLPQAGHGELLYSLFGFPAWLDGASSYAIMMHNGTTVNWLDKPAGETGSGLLAFGQTNGLHWTGNGYPYSFNGEVAARMKIPASDLSTDYEDGFYGVTVQNGEISFGEIQDPETITNDWSEVIAAIPVGDPNALSGRFTVTSTAPLTLVVSNGLVYALDPNGTMVDVTYYLPAYAVTEPTPNYPAGFAAFDFEANTTNVSASAPQIAEWTRQADPGDVIAVSAENINQTNALAVFMGSDGEVYAGDILKIDGQMLAVALPDELDAGDMYLMWLFNEHGFGTPVGINRTTYSWAWDKAATNELFSVYGTGISLDDSTCSVYVSGYGWITNTAANPYKADFTVPTDMSVGIYTAYVHNGHGGQYGWSDGFRFDVVAKTTYTGSIYNVTTYGATGDGVTDDYTAINNCLTAASAAGSRVYFPTGTYLIGTKITGSKFSNKMIYGDGMDSTIIVCSTNMNDIRMIDGGSSGAYFADLTFSTGPKSPSQYMLNMQSCSNVVWESVRVTQYDMVEYATTADPINWNKSTYMTITNCEFVLGDNATISGSAHHVRMLNCRFLGINDANTILTTTCNQFDISGGSARAHDISDAQNAHGFSKRWLKLSSVSGGSHNVYIGDIVCSNICPRIPEAWATSSPLTNVVLSTDYVYLDPSDLSYMVSNRTYNTSLQLMVIYSENSKWINQRATVSEFDADTGYIKLSKLWSTMGATPLTTNAVMILRDNVDLNSGENILGEGQTEDNRGYATASTSNTVTVAGLSTDRKGYVAVIVKGRGIGQSGIITGYSSGTITIDHNWAVIPDSTSLISIGHYLADSVVYNCNFHFPAGYYTNDTASAAVEPYGGTVNFIVDGCTVRNARNSFYSLGCTSGMTPYYFNTYKENIINDTSAGMRWYESLGTTATNAIFMGNLFSGNAISNATYGIRYSSARTSSPTSRLNVFDSNVFAAIGDLATSQFTQFSEVWNNNTATGTGTALSLNTNSPVLQDNEWTGFATTYSRSYSALQIPQGTVLLSDASKTIQLFNVGTTGLTWTATDNAAWLSVTDSGSIAAESSGTMTLSRSGSTTNGATALVSVVAAGQTNVFTVIYGDELGVE